jgi:hypothetical protein
MRSFLAVLLLVLAVAVGACKNNDPAPVVGDLELTLLYSTAYQNADYYLYTENGWLAPGVDPLRQNRVGVGTSAGNGRLQTTLTLRDLNTGNYVITIGRTSPKSVQVTAGRTNKFTLDF